MKQRARGGSIRELPSGKHQAKYKIGDEWHTAPFTFPSWDAAQTWLDDTNADIRRGVWRDDSKGKILFEAFAAEFIEIRTPDLSAGTIRNYRTLLKTQLIPAFGKKQLKDIGVKDVRLWWSRTPETVNRRNAFFMLSSMFKLAMEFDYVSAYPCRVPNAGKDVSTRRPDHTQEEFKAVLEHLPDYLRAPAWTLFTAHLRVSEMAGLSRGDFDAQTASLTVSKQDSEIGGRHLKETKTKQVRSIKPLAPGDEILREHVKRTLALPTAALFTGPKGARLSARHFRIHWDKACVAAGIENMHVHDIRHIGLTLVAQSGATNADIKKRGGHASDSAAARYQHSGIARDIEVAERASQLITVNR